MMDSEAKPYTLERAVKELKIFERMITLQTGMIEAAEELRQVSDPVLKSNCETVMTTMRDWQRQCVRFKVETERLIRKLSDGLGDLRRQ